MSRSAAMVSMVLVALLVSACDGVNCFAEDCLTGVPDGDQPSQEFQDYFFDIVLGAEDVAETLLRFPGDVDIRLRGAPASSDRSEVDAVIADLRQLTGRQIARTEGSANVQVHFIPSADFEAFTGQPGEDLDGFFMISYWIDSGEIEEVVVLISTDIQQGSPARQHVTRKMITRGFGLVNVSDRYPTSIFYDGVNDVTSYSAIDRFVITTAYDSRLQPGMTRSQMISALGW